MEMTTHEEKGVGLFVESGECEQQREQEEYQYDAGQLSALEAQGFPPGAVLLGARGAARVLLVAQRVAGLLLLLAGDGVARAAMAHVTRAGGGGKRIAAICAEVVAHRDSILTECAAAAAPQAAAAYCGSAASGGSASYAA